ncbi:MAG TPA: zf-HC2 domain-containing protein, partial [Thermoanaerobaculia bacterium]|nr:zf-HC2 domain-containing protein [Thermoanaerobaculia bacterium]
MHPAPETLAMFADGKLSRQELAPVVVHLDTCADCRTAIETANEVAGETKTRSPWLAIAAAILLALI